MPTHRSIPVLLVAAGLAGPVASAQDMVRVLTEDLRLSEGMLVEMDETALVIRDADGRSVRIPTDDLSALSMGRSGAQLPELPSPAPERLFVELTDGQRVVIDLAASDDPDALVGTVLGLGAARLPLDRVARLARSGADWHAPTPDADEVHLTNNDRLTGFISRVGPIVAIEHADGRVSEVPLDRVREVRLANPAQVTPGLLVTDNLAVTLRVHTLRVGSNAVLGITTGAQSLGVDSRGEDAIAYERPGARLAGVRSFDPSTAVHVPSAPASVSPTGGRRWTPDPVRAPAGDPHLGLNDWTLPAPAEVVLDLPTGTDRFAATLSARGGVWTDCMVSILVEDGTGARTLLAEHPLTASGPGVPLSLDLPTATRRLVVSVDPGRFGAVQDSVVLTAPRLRARP